MARPRKPLWMLRANGNYRPGKHGHRAGEMALGGGDMPPPPDFIADNPVALAEWRRLTEDPAYSPTLAPVFWFLLVEYVALTAEMLTNPEMTVAARRHRLKLAGELLLTPASRATHPLPAPASTGPNEFDDCDVKGPK